MHILIDVTSTARPDPTGIGNYARELIQALFEIDRENQYSFGIRARRYKRRKHIEHLGAGRAGFLPLLPPVYSFLRGRVHVFHALHNRLPALPGFRKVVTIHDLDSIEASELFDAHWAAKQAKRMELAIRRADIIITPSEFTKERLLEKFEVPPGKVRAVYHGVDHRHYFPRDPEQCRKVASHYGIDRPFVLNIGAYNPRKNKVNLLRAFARSRMSREGLLVLIGRQRGNFREVEAEAADLGITDHVRFLGYVEREDLAPLLSASRIFAFPTIYEGFGLPVLEAMAAGVPVLTSKISAVPEVTGDAAQFVDVFSPEAMAQALDGLWENERARNDLVQRGLARAKEFSWKRTAQQTLSVYRELAPERADSRLSSMVPQPAAKKQGKPVRRVLLIAKDFPPSLGGGPVLNTDISQILHAMGYDLRVITYTAAGDYRDEWPFPVERIPRPSEHEPCPAQRLPAVLAEFRPDAVIVSPTSKYLRPVFRVLQKFQVPYVVYCHFLRLKHTRRIAINRFLARRRYGYEGARLVAGVSHYLTEQLEKMGVPKERLRVVYPGIDPSRYRADAALREKMRRDLGIENRIVLLTVARLIDGKGQDRVIEVLPKLVAEFPEIVYLVVGGGPNEKALQALVARLGLEAHVRFLGPMANPQPFYPASDIFVLASDNPGKWFDTFGLTLVEAGASGLPVVASFMGGPPEIVEQGETGFLVDPRSPQHLLEALRRLAGDFSLREKMGRAGHERVLERFTHKQTELQIRRLLEEFAGDGFGG